MAKHSRLQVLTRMKDLGLVPLFFNRDAEIAWHVAQACAEGGCPLVEFTNRGDRAIEVFSLMTALRDERHPEIMLGAGSICDAATAALYMAAGADFIVGPLLDEGVAKTCNSRKIPYLPGCGSVTEIHQAHLLGVEICKVFPAGQVGGPGFITAVKGPCAWAELMPTGGVAPTKENLTSWFEAGAACVGMGSKLLSKTLVDRQDYDTLQGQVRHAIDLIRAIR